MPEPLVIPGDTDDVPHEPAVAHEPFPEIVPALPPARNLPTFPPN